MHKKQSNKNNEIESSNNCVTLSQVNTIAKQDSRTQTHCSLWIHYWYTCVKKETAALKFEHPVCARWEWVNLINCQTFRLSYSWHKSKMMNITAHTDRHNSWSMREYFWFRIMDNRIWCVLLAREWTIKQEDDMEKERKRERDCVCVCG